MGSNFALVEEWVLWTCISTCDSVKKPNLLEKLFQKFRIRLPSCVDHLGKELVGMGLVRVQKNKKDLLKTAACLRKGLFCCLHCLFTGFKSSDGRQTAIAVGLFSPTCVWVSNGGGLLNEHLRRACCLAGVSNA